MSKYVTYTLSAGAGALIASAITAITIATAQADDIIAPNEITVFGNPAEYDRLSGSANFISNEELEKFEFTDINSMLESIPGIYIQEEDGSGLRPNIGIRAASSLRSDKITYMEDGILMNPAPYAQPSAYYFPRAGRMYALEVAKGPAAIRFGPYTIGGALNMISTPIPEQNKGKVKTRIGEDDFSEIHAYYGGTSGKLSYLLEVYDEQSKGFKQLPDGSDTGYDITSLLGKLRYSGENQYLEVKYEYTDEVSDETYYGLTDADFASNPYQRYAGTQADEMDNEHWQWVVTHHIDFNESVSLTSKVYETWFDRNWYKLSKVGGSSFGSVVDDASKLAILKGGDSSAGCLASPTHDNCGDTDLAVKANNRQYEARGVQFKFNVDIGNHAIEAGLRIHEDEMTRVQWEDDYYMFNGQAVGYRFGIPGASGEANNRFEKAEATSLYITDEIALGRLTITPGIRMEDIDGERFEGDAAATLQPRNTRTKSNSYDETMLALSALYDLSDTTLLVGGIYEGFSPTGVSGDRGETATNYEAGIRHTGSWGGLDMFVFFSDFDNMVAICSQAASCPGQNIGDAFDGGAVEVSGIELTASSTIEGENYLMPLMLSYTFSDTEFQSSFEAAQYEQWGTVEAGFELPYVPEHQLSFTIGYQTGDWEVNASAKYKSEQRTVSGTGSIPANEKIDSIFVTDISVKRQISENLRMAVYVDNLFDDDYAVSRHPDGLRPGKPRQISVGLAADF